MNICVVRCHKLEIPAERAEDSREDHWVSTSPLPGHCNETFSDQNKCFTVVSHPHHALVSLLTSGWRVLQDPQQNSNIFITPAIGLSLTLTATSLATTPNPQKQSSVTHTYTSHWSVNWTTSYLLSYLHICYFGRSIIKWIFFPFYLTKGWTVKY